MKFDVNMCKYFYWNLSINLFVAAEEVQMKWWGGEDSEGRGERREEGKFAGEERRVWSRGEARKDHTDRASLGLSGNHFWAEHVPLRHLSWL